ncbi:hypothetical protein BU17DRAFT_72371 [Hysterangium stoloniferum]|nr:hypothetical protein BU17DRAFT_72371 [Hysterangium stoloniferum]
MSTVYPWVNNFLIQGIVSKKKRAGVKSHGSSDGSIYKEYRPFSAPQFEDVNGKISKTLQDKINERVSIRLENGRGTVMHEWQKWPTIVEAVHSIIKSVHPFMHEWGERPAGVEAGSNYGKKD